MAKTGERYTAARRHIVHPREELPTEVLGQTDANVRQNTGKGWREWLPILDAWGAKERKHGVIVTYLIQEWGVPGWWAQTITTGYERSRGKRAKYQTVAGSFQVSVSKTFPIGVGKLFKAFTQAPQRRAWLQPGMLKVRTTRKDLSARFDFGDGTSRVVAYFDPKDRRKTTVTVMHELLPSASSVEEMRGMWKEHLKRLADVLQP
jgi:uncharacterized protein YndB with AHSA1/START domain